MKIFKKIKERRFKKQTERRINKITYRKVLTEALGVLEGEEKEKLNTLIDKGDLEEVLDYVEEKLPGIIKEKSEDTYSDLDFIKSEIRKNLEEMKAEEGKK